MPNRYDLTTFSFILTSGNPGTPESLLHFWNENLVVKNIKYITYDGNPSRKRFIDLLFRNKNKEVSTLVALERLRAEMTRKTSSPILTKSSKKNKRWKRHIEFMIANYSPISLNEDNMNKLARSLILSNEPNGYLMCSSTFFLKFVLFLHWQKNV